MLLVSEKSIGTLEDRILFWVIWMILGRDFEEDRHQLIIIIDKMPNSLGDVLVN